MFTSAVLMLSLAATNAAPASHVSTPPHRISAAGPHHPSVHLSTGTLAQVYTNASWLDRLFGKRDDCSLVDPQGTSAERAYYRACARHGTTGLLDCHIGYTFRYVTAADRGGGQFAACFRGCAPFLADVQRAEDARRSEQIPMVFGAVQAVGEKLVGEIAAEASGLDLDASSVAVSRTDRIVRELIRPGLIYGDTAAVRTHTIVGNVDDARALFDTISAGGRDVTTRTYQKGGTLVQCPDGTRIGFRPNAGGGTSPAVDINIPGFTQKQIKFHFTDH
ncbi:MAG TPA: hypothetical protein VH134_13285 [Candidatus Dormibacteraeota bacterium]|jgi:hypothetical protein|nr:hypothetical protein [Candidatus Dormibacteraeota bacterium]